MSEIKKKRGRKGKPLIGTSLATGEVVEFASSEDARRVGGFCRWAVSRAARGLYEQHGGFTWRYK